MSRARRRAAPGVERLRAVELFADLDERRLRRLAATGSPVELADGAVLFEDGEQARYFYVLLTGELLITKTVAGREEVFARHRAEVDALPPARDGKPTAAHQFTGELPMLAGGGYVAKAVAVGRTCLLAFDHDAFYEMLARCPEVCRTLLPVLAWRIHSYEEKVGRRSMLEGLGTLAAGLAHELNNPTAALLRTASDLRTAVLDLADRAVAFGELTSPVERRAVRATLAAVVAAETRSRLPVAHDPLAAEDAENRVSDWLDERGIDDGGELAAVLAEHRVTTVLLDELADQLRPAVLPVVIGYLCFRLHTDELVADLTEAGGRIEALVRSTKAYSNLDRAPQQDLDVLSGIEATLAMLAAKLGAITVVRDYADLPSVRGYPRELNQVWTNLIDNAIDAMAGTAATGALRITARTEADDVVIEIRDDGPGIPADVLPWLFQPFFTTKDIGKGTGLGLHLCRDVITQRHQGSIEVSSVAGDTRFTVRLPRNGR